MAESRPLFSETLARFLYECSMGQTPEEQAEELREMGYDIDGLAERIRAMIAARERQQ